MKLENIKEGDVIVREIEGRGLSMKCLTDIETVNGKGIFIDGCDQDFSDDSVYGFNFDGSAFANFIPGFKSKILRKATEQDIIDYSDDY